MSIGVWVGLIALLGVDAETGVFMLLYLDLAYERAKRDGALNSLRDLQECIQHGAVKRIRPKFKTVATMFAGLIPIMWSTQAGADVMKRIAAPMIGGIFTSFALLESTEIRGRADHAAKLVPSVRDRSSRSRMNFTRIEVAAAVARNCGRVLRRARATTCSEGASPGRMVRIQEPKDCQTSLGCVAERN